MKILPFSCHLLWLAALVGRSGQTKFARTLLSCSEQSMPAAEHYHTTNPLLIHCSALNLIALYQYLYRAILALSSVQCSEEQWIGRELVVW